MKVHETSVQLGNDHPEPAPIRAVYQGIAGAYGEEAIRRLWRGRAQAVPARTFSEALDELIRGRVPWAVIPVWNSTIGAIAQSWAALRVRGSSVTVVSEIDIPVRHCLLGLPGTSVADVRFVGSHPVALAQCAKLFATRPELTQCNAFNTAGAARELSLLGDPHRAVKQSWCSSLRVDTPSQLAVIASADAGRRYGLSILCGDVQDDASNVTRFVVVRAKAPRRP
jgi:prephenate dehydratase